MGNCKHQPVKAKKHGRRVRCLQPEGAGPSYCRPELLQGLTCALQNHQKCTWDAQQGGGIEDEAVHHGQLVQRLPRNVLDGGGVRVDEIMLCKFVRV